MLCMLNMKKIISAYVLKYNSNREKQIILLLISCQERLHYLEVKKTTGIIEKK